MLMSLAALVWSDGAAHTHMVDGLTSAAMTGDWQARVLAYVFLVFGLPIVVYIFTHPALLKRRARAGPVWESNPRQKVIVTLLYLCLIALFVVTAVDRARGWSHIPTPIALLGDVFVAAGLLVIFIVFLVNPFAAATVNVEAEQTVISTGPYALVRHPFYTGLLLLFLGAPLGVGVLWGLTVYVPIVAVIVWRLRDEERYLAERLPGYSEYCAKVTYRLIPYIW
jgi:protein-S-isoprenylcysteine O-methyltransferase Ste14